MNVDRDEYQLLVTKYSQKYDIYINFYYWMNISYHVKTKQNNIFTIVKDGLLNGQILYHQKQIRK